MHSVVPSLRDVGLHCDALSLGLEDGRVGVFHLRIVSDEEETSGVCEFSDYSWVLILVESKGCILLVEFVGRGVDKLYNCPALRSTDGVFQECWFSSFEPGFHDIDLGENGQTKSREEVFENELAVDSVSENLERFASELFIENGLTHSALEHAH